MSFTLRPAKAPDVLSFYREFTSTAPDELTVYAVRETTSSGIPVIVVNLCYCGPLSVGAQLLESLRKFGSPLVDLVHERPYYQTISHDTGAPDGRHYDEKAYSLKGLSNEVIEIISESCKAVHHPIHRC